MMIPLKLLAILILAAHDIHGGGLICIGEETCCGKDGLICGQGEGDCDIDEDCLDGLVCTFDGWFGTDYCKAGPKTKNFEWLDWGDWSKCSVECGGDGIQKRMRTCSAPVFGGYPCPSPTEFEDKECNNGPCPVNGGWGAWNDWDDCPVSCGGADHSRARACDSPAPDHGGDDCTIDGSTNTETESCNDNPCPIHGGFSDWDAWGPCIGIGELETTCGGGGQTRSRRCDTPAPQFGGLDCDGEPTSCQRCNMEPCPSKCPKTIWRD